MDLVKRLKQNSNFFGGNEKNSSNNSNTDFEEDDKRSVLTDNENHKPERKAFSNLMKFPRSSSVRERKSKKLGENNPFKIKSYNQKILEQVEHRQKGSSFRLKPGEHELLSGLITFYSSVGELGIDGVLYVTNFRLYFEPAFQSKNTQIFIPLMTIAKIEKLKKEKGIEVICKDFRNPKIVFTTDWGDRLYDFLNQVAFSEKSRNFFSFDYGALVSYPLEDDGWEIYDPENELKRIFKTENNEEILNHGWRISHCNRTYQLCQTYPRVFCIPKDITDKNLEKISQFRSSSRIPILSWFDSANSATISRSSQPKVGLSGRERNLFDENLFQGISNANKTNRKVFLMDARPKLNAVANQANKGGFENMNVYNDAELEFLDIGNIHVMRESYEKLKNSCLSSKQSWLQTLDSSKWFDHVTLLLQASVRIAKYITGGYSVLCHCSDGWDRTSQLVSLCLLLLDPFYRTIKGFEILIEKEWCSTGHRFDTRSGHGSKNVTDSQRAPIFPQWLDCVYQLIVQFPNHFQFNEQLLLDIYDALYSCEYGTFLYDCDKERQFYARAFSKKNSNIRFTVSLWSDVNAHLSKYTNVHYRQELVDRIYPRYETKFLSFWKTNYLRHLDGGFPPPLEPEKELGLLRTRLKELEILVQKEKDRKQTIRRTCEPLGRTHASSTPVSVIRREDSVNTNSDNINLFNSTEIPTNNSENTQAINTSPSQTRKSNNNKTPTPTLPRTLQWQIASFQKSELRPTDSLLITLNNLQVEEVVSPRGQNSIEEDENENYYYEEEDENTNRNYYEEEDPSIEISHSGPEMYFANPPKNPPPPVPTNTNNSNSSRFRSRTENTRPTPPPKNTKPNSIILARKSNLTKDNTNE